MREQPDYIAFESTRRRFPETFARPCSRWGEDSVCRRLMTVPGVGPVVAVTFQSAVDDPSRIAKSKAVGAIALCPFMAFHSKTRPRAVRCCFTK
jgi:hypothetical protein